MLIRRPADIPASAITHKAAWLTRRSFLTAVPALVASAAGAQPAPRGRTLPPAAASAFSTRERKNSWNEITSYTNFYEFGVEKEDAPRFAGRLTTDPWSVAVEGECGRAGSYPLDDILRGQALEERIYRLRCVEGWSMVIPWIGFPLSSFIRRCEPNARAAYVELTTRTAPSEMPGLRSQVLRWPYVEALRMDEAMHPLTILCVGLYGEVLPNQNGAPLRLVVPWKYGFKSIKSIVTIRFVERRPVTSWERAIPEYYGFYSNVNPGRTDSVFRDQSRERRIGEFFMRRTGIFNGYADQVASLYSSLDLRRNY